MHQQHTGITISALLVSFQVLFNGVMGAFDMFCRMLD